MFKNILKTILTIILLLLILLLFFTVIKPAYINYKSNQKKVIVDTSGERATSRNKVSKENISPSTSNNNRATLEKKENFDPIVFDDRILLYEGTLNADSTKELIDILVEDIESKTFSKVDVSLNGTDISYENKENYSSNLINFKNSISETNSYIVEFNYTPLNAIVNKVIIKIK